MSFFVSLTNVDLSTPYLSILARERVMTSMANSKLGAMAARNAAVSESREIIGDEEDDANDGDVVMSDKLIGDDESDDDEDEEDEEDNNNNKNTSRDDNKESNPFDYLAEPPNSMKGLVACRACALVKTFDQFYENYCENCDIMVEDRNLRIRVTTTPHFDGLCGMFQPQQSWAARWQGFNSLKPGLYALKVLEELPNDIKAELDQRKEPYLKEDTGTREQEAESTVY